LCTRGELRRHRELLDWLGVEVRGGGTHARGDGAKNPQSASRNGRNPQWDVKALLKSIVMSATYRQSSKITPQSLQRDPDNRLLPRGPRFRLPAEMIGAQALFFSLLLV